MFLSDKNKIDNIHYNIKIENEKEIFTRGLLNSIRKSETN